MRVLIAEDGALFREGLRSLLVTRGHEVAATVDDADNLVAVALECRPDIVIADIRMPSSAGIDGAIAAVALAQQLPECGILLLSQHIELRHCQSLVGTSGFGYLLKDRVLDLPEFDRALTRIAQGGSVLDPEIVRSLVRSSEPGRLSGLTPREIEVLGEVAEGHSNQAIADTLHLSARTIETHMRSIFLKLDLPDDGSAHRRVLAVIAYLNRQ